MRFRRKRHSVSRTSVTRAASRPSSKSRTPSSHSLSPGRIRRDRYTTFISPLPRTRVRSAESHISSQFQAARGPPYPDPRTVHHKGTIFRHTAMLVAAVATAACSDARSEGNGGARPAAGAAVPGPGGAAGGDQTLTLAPTDVAVAKATGIIDGIPITGNLRPIETVMVRARLEGDLQGVYVREGDRVRSGQLLAR